MLKFVVELYTHKATVCKRVRNGQVSVLYIAIYERRFGLSKKSRYSEILQLRAGRRS